MLQILLQKLYIYKKFSKMGRTPHIKTKPIATRISMADYIKILQECNSKGISVSEYVAEKLSFHILENGGNIEDFEKQLSELKKENEDLIKDNKLVRDAVKSSQITLNELRKENEQLSSELSEYRKNYR